MIAAMSPQRTSEMEKIAFSAATTTVAGCDYPGTAAEATALHQGNRWNGRGIEPLHGLRSRAGDADVLFARGAPHIVEPFQVGTGLKMRSVAAHDDGAKAARACQRIQRGIERPAARWLAHSLSVPSGQNMPHQTRPNSIVERITDGHHTPQNTNCANRRRLS